jgi:hypothetical protein
MTQRLCTLGEEENTSNASFFSALDPEGIGFIMGNTDHDYLVKVESDRFLYYKVIIFSYKCFGGDILLIMKIYCFSFNFCPPTLEFINRSCL